jgi:dipeptidyl aminopeptidase/acylaminoacyl peptidase
MKTFSSILAFFFFLITGLEAQINLDYQKPPQPILDLVEAPLPPQVRLNSAGDQMVLLFRDQFRTIAEMSEPEMKLAGRRINPDNSSNSRTRYYKKISLMKVGHREEMLVTGLPVEPRLSDFTWSADESKMAFTHTEPDGIQLWVLDMTTAKARKVTDAALNGTMGSPYAFHPDGNRFMVKVVPDDKETLVDKKTAIPTGPTISQNDGTMAQNRTYQDLLKNPVDEYNFEQLIRSELHMVTLDGQSQFWMEADMYDDISFSPNGEYVMITIIQKPFSYLVPVYRFPQSTDVYDLQGDLVKNLHKMPLVEDLPPGFGSTYDGKRSISWRNDKPASIQYAQALDGGDPENEVEYRDELFSWDAPFDGNATSLLKTHNRYSYVIWGNDEVALAYDNWFKNRNTKTYLFNPSQPDAEPHILIDRNTQDQYANPGNFATARNRFGQNVLKIHNNSLYATGPGYSDEGMKPFLDAYNLETLEVQRLWQADGEKTLEQVEELLDLEEGKIMTSIQSATDYPNYYIRDLNSKRSPEQVTFFENPFESLQSVHKEVIQYSRDDGVDLSGTLYLPAGYDRSSGERLPMLLWAYPREFKDRQSAGQVTTSPHRFTYPYYGSPIFWVTRGYAVLDGASFPIIGVGDEEPNDSFVEQLVGNGKAAIDALYNLGYVDRDRVGVGGHSYGAFMTANLLSHSDLFAAGIARSGAYNRTLTPFGFQREERTYWEAPEIYYQMSPFMHADKMKTPLLMTHGEDDNNSGTYPLQSLRYFNALKGLGATVRLVMLPKESHGYAARESILHLLWEQDQWLEKYVKNRHELAEGVIKP